LTGSGLEREWLEMVDQSNLRLPNEAQLLIESCGVRPDFYYDTDGYHVAIFIDGPYHDLEAQKSEDEANDEKLFLAGIESLRFHYLEKDSWPDVLADRSDIVG
jgi:hypothetical protein